MNANINIKRFFLIIIVSIIHFQAYSCMCIGTPDIKNAYKQADLVIIGKIINVEFVRIWSDTTDLYSLVHNMNIIDSTVNYEEIKKNAFSITMLDYTVRITSEYKRKSKIKKIRTGFGYGDCGFQFEVGKEYLIYAKRESSLRYRQKKMNRARKELKGIYRVNICSRTKLLSDASEEITYLQEK